MNRRALSFAFLACASLVPTIAHAQDSVPTPAPPPVVAPAPVPAPTPTPAAPAAAREPAPAPVPVAPAPTQQPRTAAPAPVRQPIAPAPVRGAPAPPPQRPAEPTPGRLRQQPPGMAPHPGAPPQGLPPFRRRPVPPPRGFGAQHARARVLTGSLFQQLGHVARRRSIAPCDAYEQFKSFKPFADATDPWGHKLVFQCDSGTLLVVSTGPDGQLGNDDDIVNGRVGAARRHLALPTPAKKIAKAEPEYARSKRRYGIALALFLGAVVATVVVRDVYS